MWGYHRALALLSAVRWPPVCEEAAQTRWHRKVEAEEVPAESVTSSGRLCNPPGGPGKIP